jgi:predicted DNA binding protein
VTVDVSFTVAADELPLGRSLLDAPVRAARFLEFVPLAKPYVWLETDAPAAVDARLSGDPTVETARAVAEAGRRRLYRIERRAGTDAMLVALARCGLTLREVAVGERWEFRALAPGRAAIRRFREACATADVDVSVRALREPGPPDGPETNGALTTAQREALELAYELGYFECPREATLADLSGRLDITTQAVSDRLRRALRRLVRESLGRREQAPAGTHSKP